MMRVSSTELVALLSQSKSLMQTDGTSVPQVYIFLLLAERLNYTNMEKNYGRYIEESEVKRIEQTFNDPKRQEEAVYEIVKTRMRNEYNYRLTYIGNGKYRTEGGSII